MIDFLTPVACFFGMILAIVYVESKRREPCPHLRTRCIHGDEINWRAKQYVFRFWKPDVVRRQSCLDCNAALDRVAVCTGTGEEMHDWEGPWPY